MTDPQRMMHIMKYAFIGSVMLFIVVTIEVPSRAAHPPEHSLELVIIVLALADLALGFVARTLLGRLAKGNVGRSGKTTPLNQWASANLASLAMIESCALVAVVLHVLGSSTRLVGILFGAALLALFAWTPGTPPASSEASGITRT